MAGVAGHPDPCDDGDEDGDNENDCDNHDGHDFFNYICQKLKSILLTFAFQMRPYCDQTLDIIVHMYGV